MMINDVIDIILSILLVIGSSFILLASIGLVRFDEVLSRIHATTKAGTLGAGLMLVAGALSFQDLHLLFKAVLAFVFILITAPIGAHIFSRASVKYGAKRIGSVDHLKGQYDELGGLPRSIIRTRRDEESNSKQ